MNRARPDPVTAYEISPGTSFREDSGGSDPIPETPGLQLGRYRYFIGLPNGDPVLMRCQDREPGYLAEVLDHELLGITGHDLMLAVRECPGHEGSDVIPVSDHMCRKLQILFR